MRIVFLLLFGCLFCAELTAQDKHFSQFYNSPLTLNPALTGGFSGRYRIAGIYRDQGRQVFENPYTTVAAQIDFMFPIKKVFPKIRNEDRMGIGVLFFNDKVSSLDFTTNQMAMSFAYHKLLDKSTNQFLSLGYQIGLSQRNLNYGNLTFQDQFDGLSDFTLPTQETTNIPENNFSYSDMNIGLNYAISPNRQTSIYAGVAYHHFNRPQVSFYANDENEIINAFGNHNLESKLTGHLSARLKVNNYFHVLPKFLYHAQGPAHEMNLGANLKFVFNEYNNSSFYFGAWTRLVANEASFAQTPESIIVQGGVDLGGFNISLAYDMSISTISRFRQNDGTLEISIIYIGESNDGDDFVICPEF